LENKYQLTVATKVVLFLDKVEIRGVLTPQLLRVSHKSTVKEGCLKSSLLI